MNPKRSVVFLRSNPISPDPRVEKEARALWASGYKVKIVGWNRFAAFPLKETRDFAEIHRIRVPFYSLKRKGLQHLPGLLCWEIKLLSWLWRNRKDYNVIHACDFDTVIPAILIGKILRKIVIYDIFDFYADMLRNTPKPISRVVRWLDLRLISKVNAVILPDESRLHQIRGSKPKRLEIIYNAPDPEILLSKAISTTEDDGIYSLRIAYVGLLQLERGIMEMLSVLANHPDWHLDLAGYGSEESTIVSAALKLPNVRVFGRVPYEEAIRIMSRADVLFATYDPSIPNHRYSSPNKLFEALPLGKPIIVARGTGVDKIVERYNLGFVVDYGDRNQLEKTLQNIASWTPEEKENFAKRTKFIYEQSFSWKESKKRLLKLYDEVLTN